METILQQILNALTRKKKMRVTFLVPITQSGTTDLIDNVAGLRNGGNSTIQLNNGSWTLKPGETLFWGSQNDINEMSFLGLLIQFEPTPGETLLQKDLLQIFSIKNC
jgi:hypothetical protein